MPKITLYAAVAESLFHSDPWPGTSNTNESFN